MARSYLFWVLASFLCSDLTVAGFDLKSGAWNLNVSGGVSGFYTLSKCDTQKPIAGGFTCAGSEFETSIQSGYFVPSIVFSVSTAQSDIDLNATIGFFPGINNFIFSGANGVQGNRALGTPALDVEKIFFTLGFKNVGTLKLGRDLGIFAGKAAYGDMSRIGAILGQAPPGNGTLGAAGSGYMYADFLPQISFESASMLGFRASLGIFQPLNSEPYPFTSHSGSSTLHHVPSIQSQLSYAYEDTCFKGEAWSAFLYQHHQARTLTEFGFDSFGLDGGLNLDFKSIAFVGHVYWGSGIGMTGLFMDAISTTGEPRKTLGGYAQLSAKLNPFTLGMSFGRSALDQAGNDSQQIVHFNQSIVAFAQLALTESSSIVAEYANIFSENWATERNTENTFGLGSSFFF